MEGLDVGFKNGSIRLEEIPAVYYSGQTINGSIVFDLRRPQNFTSITIQYLGEATVLWTETETEEVHGVKRERVTKYQSHEIYFNEMETVAGGFGTSELPRTYQTFPFKFQIPFMAPSSFQGEHGSVSYTITATIVYPNLEKDELKKEFTVVAPLDLNRGNPAIKEPTELVFSDDVTSCCICFWSSHSVTIRIKLPMTGYCPGQVIAAAVEVENLSGVEITKLIFEILTRELYRSRQPPSEYIVPEKVLAITERGAVMARTKKNFICNMAVPAIIPANLENCTVIDVGYFFRATFKLSGCNDDLQDEAEICLGLVPINETLEERYIHPMAHLLPSGPVPEPVIFNEVNPNVNRSNQNLAHRSNLNIAHRSNQNIAHRSNQNIAHRSNQNIAQNNQDEPPPYPGKPYPTNNPAPSREIGFVTPKRLSACDMPEVSPPPYPGAAPMGSAYPPYPDSAAIPLAPYPSGSFAPSAPPQ